MLSWKGQGSWSPTPGPEQHHSRQSHPEPKSIVQTLLELCQGWCCDRFPGRNVISFTFTPFAWIPKQTFFSYCYFKLRNCQVSLFMKDPSMISLIHITYQWSVKLEFKKQYESQTRKFREVLKKTEKFMRKGEKHFMLSYLRISYGCIFH